jgi:hypothetical protein
MAKSIQNTRLRPFMTMRLSNYHGTGPILFYAWVGFIIFSALIDYSLFNEKKTVA